MKKGAIFSPCRTYRYTLLRIWDDAKPMLNVCALNPSTADEEKDDPTIRREIGFAQAWGYGGLVKTNLFAFRATNPRVMKAAIDPIGLENDAYIKLSAEGAGLVLLAWGADGAHRSRASWVYHKLLKPFHPHCLAITKDGHPGHPLYLKGDLKPIPFTWRSR